MGFADRPLARDISGDRTATSFRGQMDPLICCQPGLAGRTCSSLDRPRHRCGSVGRLCFFQPTLLAKDEDPVNPSLAANGLCKALDLGADAVADCGVDALGEGTRQAPFDALERSWS